MANWSDLPATLKGSFAKFTEILQSDAQLKAFTTTNAIDKPVTFAIKSSGSDNALLITVENGSVKAATGNAKDGLFALSALPEQWEQFFKDVPVAPSNAFWARYGVAPMPS